MIKKNKFKNIVWIDLENPSIDEVRTLTEEYKIDPIVSNELLSPTIRPKVDVHENYLYLILHFPTAHSHKELNQDIRNTQEIDFIISKDFIITVHYDAIDELHEFSKIFEVNSILDKSDMSKHGGYIFYYMIQHLYKDMTNKIENVVSLLNDIESEIFEGKENKMVIELSKLNRILLTFRDSFYTHKEILKSFEIAGENFYGKDFRYHLRSIVGEYYKVSGAIKNTKEYLNELRNTNDSLLSSKQNEIMKTLTIMAFVTFPLSLIPGIFGMNTSFIPIVGVPGDFWVVILIMATMALIMYLFFRFKKWI